MVAVVRTRAGSSLPIDLDIMLIVRDGVVACIDEQGVFSRLGTDLHITVAVHICAKAIYL